MSGTAFYDGFELWNQGPDVDISNWKLVWNDNQNTSGEYTFPSGFTVKSGITIVFMDDEGQANDSTIIYSGANMSWDVGTTELSVSVLDNSGSGVDFVRSSGNSDSPPQGTSWSGSGISLSNGAMYRKQNADNDTQDDWAGATDATFNFLNPGQTNCIFPNWLTPSAVEGIVISTSSDKVTFTFDATGFPSGTILTDKMWIHHNAPQQTSPMEVACTLNVNIVEIIVDNDPNVEDIVSFVAIPNPVDMGLNSGVSLIYNAKKIKRAQLKIFDQIGNLIDSYDSGDDPGFTKCNKYVWDLKNKYGRKVAGGMYLAVLRIVDDKGNVTVKKTKIGVIQR